VLPGTSVTLVPIFSNGRGAIDQGIGPVVSGTPIVVTITQSTFFRLTVYGADGSGYTPTVAQVEVSIPPAPTILLFRASPKSIIIGESVGLLWEGNSGEATIDNGVGPIRAGYVVYDEPAVSTTYTLTVTGALGWTVSRSVSVVVEKFSVTVITPAVNELVADDLNILATVRSNLDIVSIGAELEGRSTPLIYDVAKAGFVGALSLTGLSPGPHMLTVIAEDIEGDIITRQVPVIFDHPPTLSIVEPLPFSVARPDIHVEASCSDDAGDCQLEVWAIGPGLHPLWLKVATGTNVVSQTVDLSAFDGERVSLRFDANDSSNQLIHGEERKPIYVEGSARLETVADFPDELVDFDGERALTRGREESGDDLSLHYLSSAAVEAVEVPPNRLAVYSFLSSTGVIYQTQDKDQSSLRRLYDWNGGVLLDVGQQPDGLVVSGDFAIWSEGSNLWLRQVSTQTNVLMSSSASSDDHDVAENGVVVYRLNAGSIEKYDAGVQTTVVSDPAFDYAAPLTDGNGVVYLKSGAPGDAIAFHDGSNEIVLTNFRDKPWGNQLLGQISGGWVAYTELGGLGQTHVWTRDPVGQLLQRTFFGSNSFIDALASNGEVMILNLSRRYLSDASGQSADISSPWGTSVNIDGQWFLMIGRSLFLVNEQ